MRDIPIIMSAPMVLALLAGRKTMTRRMAWHPAKAKMVECDHGYDTCPICDKPKPTRWQKVKPGDRLWARESLRNDRGFWRYRADDVLIELPHDDPRIGQMVAWAHHQEREAVPSIHMPRWASRITLVVESAKIERLAEITDEDAKAEGVELPLTMSPLDRGAYRHCFMTLWNTLHGEGPADPAPWAANPLVVPISFKPHLINIDAMPRREAA